MVEKKFVVAVSVKPFLLFKTVSSRVKLFPINYLTFVACLKSPEKVLLIVTNPEL